MPICQAIFCENRRRNCPGKSFFSIPDPQKDRERCAKWLRNIGNTKFNINTYKHSRNRLVCEDHFDASSFDVDRQALCLGYKPRRILKPDAVPTIFQHETYSSNPWPSTVKRDQERKQKLDLDWNESLMHGRDSREAEQHKKQPFNMNLRKRKEKPSPEVEMESQKDTKTRKTKAEIQKAFRERIRANPYRHAKRKEYDRLQGKRYRPSRTEEKKEHGRQLSREMAMRKRQQIRASGSGKSATVTKTTKTSTQAQAQKVYMFFLDDSNIIDTWERQKMFFRRSGNDEDEFTDQDFVFHLLTVHAEKCVASSCSTGLFTTQRKTEPNPPTNFSHRRASTVVLPQSPEPVMAMNFVMETSPAIDKKPSMSESSSTKILGACESSDQSRGQDKVVSRLAFSEVIGQMKDPPPTETPSKNSGLVNSGTPVTIKVEIDDNEVSVEEYNMQPFDEPGQSKDSGREETRSTTSDPPVKIKVEEAEEGEVTSSTYNLQNSITKENEMFQLRMAQVRRLSSKCTVCHKILQGERVQPFLENERKSGGVKCASCLREDSLTRMENGAELRTSWKPDGTPEDDIHEECDGADGSNDQESQYSDIDPLQVQHSGRSTTRGTCRKGSYQCDSCFKVFSRKGDLCRHVTKKVCTHYVNLMCELCSETFDNRSDLSTHMRIHAGDSLHKCNVCSLIFLSKSLLNMHMPSHTLERPLNTSDVQEFFFF